MNSPIWPNLGDTTNHSSSGSEYGLHHPKVTLFWPILTPPPLSHFVTHPGTPSPKKVRHTSRIFSRPSTESRTKALCTNSLSIVRGGFCQRDLSEGLLSERFCPEWFLSVPLSVRIHLLQQI